MQRTYECSKNGLYMHCGMNSDRQIQVGGGALRLIPSFQSQTLFDNGSLLKLLGSPDLGAVKAHEDDVDVSCIHSSKKCPKDQHDRCCLTNVASSV